MRLTPVRVEEREPLNSPFARSMTMKPYAQ